MNKKILSIALCIAVSTGIFVLSSCVNNTSPETIDTQDTRVEETDSPEDINMLPAGEVRIISMNLDGNTPTIEKRAEIMIPRLLEYEPDSIGTQEVIYSWSSVLKNALGEKYGRIGNTDEGPVEKAAASAVYIYYNKEKFDVVASGTVWLTETPTKPAGRTCTWGVFEDKLTGLRYAHVNTHLEWIDDEENKFQMAIIRDLCKQLESLGYPVFATGDFNTSEGSDSYQIMTSTEFIDDSKFVAEKSMDMGTMHGGSPNPVGRKPIDFCFVTGDKMTVHEYEVINSVIDDNTFMSDHNGLFVRATINSLPDQLQFSPVISTDGITMTVKDVRPYVAEITITQADDTFMIDAYRVSAVDPDGNEIVVRQIPSRYLHVEVPSELPCTLTGLSPATEYKVNISPMALTGAYAEPISFTIVTPNIE